MTERSIVEDEHRVVELLKRIKQMGIKLSLDDYGSGYNSLNYLVNPGFYFDYIKIDKSFIDHITEEQGKMLCEGIIKTAHVLGIKVIAEGVETEEQVNILKEIDCDLRKAIISINLCRKMNCYTSSKFLTDIDELALIVL